MKLFVLLLGMDTRSRMINLNYEFYNIIHDSVHFISVVQKVRCVTCN